MIIHSIHATNVLKYSKLDLDNIPEKGIIAINGSNESGKTAIAETICFALFGQTYANGPENITRIIHWGESSCSVELVFKGAGDISYTVSRSVDKQGMHSAEIYRSGEDTPYAIGPQAVQEEIFKVCGFDYEQFLDSLYLAQMEITSAASQSDTIKAIAGTSDIEFVIGELKHEISIESDSIAAIEQEEESIRTQIASLDIQEDRLAAIEKEKQQYTEQIDVHKEEISVIQETSTHIREAGKQIQDKGYALVSAGRDISINQWQEHLASVAESTDAMRESVNTLEMESKLRSGERLNKYINKLQSRLSLFERVREKCKEYRSELGAQLDELGASVEAGTVPLPKQQSGLKFRLLSQRFFRGMMGLLMVVLILATVLLWIGWWLLIQNPDSEISVTLSYWLNQYTSWWDPSYLSSLKNAAIAFSIITLLTFIIPTRMTSRIKTRRRELEEISTRLETVRKQASLLDQFDYTPIPELSDSLRELGCKPLAIALQDYTEEDGATFLSEQAFADHQEKLNGLLDDNANNVGVLRETIASRVGKLNQLSEELHDKISKIDREIEDTHARQKEAADLEAIIKIKQPALNEHRQRIQVREIALELATGTCSSIYNHFNQVINKYTSVTMPKLTEKRYKQIQIDDDLQVRVFASEKNDFAELDELSSGTQRQIMLAVRLAISKALVEAGQQGKQFIILDEPFAFFDRERIRNTIKSLPTLDKNITQFWIISQEFETPDQFELAIDCSRGSDELVLPKEG